MNEKVNILVVEDESIVGIDLRLTLKKLNYNVIDILRTGEDAIVKAMEHQPDLILMDIMLGGKINGIEAAEKIKKNLNVPIIYLTAYADQNTLQSAKLTEPFGYILKPFEERSLFSTIEMALYKHKMEFKLKESEERYRLLVELSPIAIGILSDRKVIYANSAAANIFGAASPKDLIGKPILDFVHPEFMNLINDRLRKLFKEKKGFDAVNEKFIRTDGKTIDAEFTVIPIKHQGKQAAQIIIRDITEENKRDKVQRTNLKILQSTDLTDSTDELYNYIHSVLADYMLIKNFFIALYDDQKNIISFPYYVDEINPKPKEREFSNGLIEYVISTGKSLLLNQDQITELVSKDQIEIFGKRAKTWLGVPLKMKGKNIGVLVFKEYQDQHLLSEREKELLELVSFPISRIIERKLIEEERKKNTAKLEELNETKDKFFSIISHDLRSPFDSILGFTEILKNDYKELSEEEIVLFIDSLYQSSRHIYNILNSLLEYSRFQLGKIDFDPKQLLLNTIIEKNLEALKGIAIKKHINLNNNINENISVFADEDMLNSVILNLTTNAIKFTGSGGRVTINAEDDDGFAKVSVKDNGIGMDKEKKSNLFNLDASQSTLGTADETGTGLGLLLSKEFIEKNGGKISVKSSLGKGSCFTFTLPMVKEN